MAPQEDNSYRPGTEAPSCPGMRQLPPQALHPLVPVGTEPLLVPASISPLPRAPHTLDQAKRQPSGLVFPTKGHTPRAPAPPIPESGEPEVWRVEAVGTASGGDALVTGKLAKEPRGRQAWSSPWRAKSLYVTRARPVNQEPGWGLVTGVATAT